MDMSGNLSYIGQPVCDFVSENVISCLKMDCSVSICESTRISRVSRTPSGNEQSMKLRRHQRSETALAPLLRFRDGSFTGTISSSEFQLVDKGHSRMATSGRSSSVTMLASASSLDRLIGLRRGRLGRVWSFPSPNLHRGAGRVSRT